MVRKMMMMERMKDAELDGWISFRVGRSPDPPDR